VWVIQVTIQRQYREETMPTEQNLKDMDVFCKRKKNAATLSSTTVVWHTTPSVV
jgi:hypothetical protein